MDWSSSFFCADKTSGHKTSPKKSSRETFIPLLLLNRGRIAPSPVFRKKKRLFARRQMGATVALVAPLVRLRADRTILAVADRGETIRRHTELNQEFLGGGGAPIAQAEIV